MTGFWWLLRRFLGVLKGVLTVLERVLYQTDILGLFKCFRGIVKLEEGSTSLWVLSDAVEEVPKNLMRVQEGHSSPKPQ